MNRLYIIVFIFFCFYSENNFAQITIHPEVGVSYLPFKAFQGNHPPKQVNSLDFLFGVSAEMPINQKWSIKTRFSYSDRKDIDLYSSIHIAAVSDKYIHSDFNIDWSAKYELNNLIEVGGGPSLLKSFEHRYSTYFWYDGEVTYNYQNLGNLYFALNGGVSLTINRFKIHLNYVRIFRLNDYIRYYSMEKWTSGCNRFDLTVSYHLLGGKKGKK